MRLPKPVSEERRQLDVLVRYGSAFRNLLRLDQLGPSADTDPLPTDYIPQPSSDSSLTAFAQLACLRLGGTRALISLIDDRYQHILAEATPDLLLRAGSHDRSSSPLWLGSVSLPRTWSICEKVVEIDPETVETFQDTVYVVNDLSQSEHHKCRTYVTGRPHLRFYAGVALVSSRGAIVGTLCIFDDKPRDGLSEEETLLLQDLAATVMEYMDTYTISDKFKRGEQLTRSLISFAEGHSAIQSLGDESSVRTMPDSSHLPSGSLSTPDQAPSLAGSSRPASLRFPAGSITSATSTLPQSVGLSTHQSSNFASVKALQESILPSNSRIMFARAARLIQASSNLDGVLLLDASVAGVGKSNAGVSEHGSVSQQDSSDASSASKTSSSDDSDNQNARFGPRVTASSRSHKTCQVLGFATPERSDFGGDNASLYRTFHETDLTRLLRIYPNGKVLNFTASGETLSTDDSSDSDISAKAGLPALEASRGSRPKRSGTQLERLIKALRTLLPDARSLAFVPFWDYERSRWFAGCLCWSNRPERQLSEKLDLAYFKVFSHSIMTELSRLDALASSQAKTSFVSSISHELRSPLHGILGTLEFFKDTQLDLFQISMLNSLGACGQTLLDTINHVLDYAKSGDTGKNTVSKRVRGKRSVRLASKTSGRRRFGGIMSQDPALDLAVATEEVVEACFSGTSYKYLVHEDLDLISPQIGLSSVEENPFDQSWKRKSRYVVLDIAHEDDWNYCVPAGSWRRVLMNLLGNALKYTDSGHVHVSLRSEPIEHTKNDVRTITLSVSDSGRGIGYHFLANTAFQPFTQENPHSAGTGLGLSIVQQVIENIGGKIEMTSDPSVGTDAVVNFQLPQPEEMVRETSQRAQFREILPLLENRRISILHKTRASSSDQFSLPDRRESLARFTDAIAATMADHLKMDVTQTQDWTHEADYVLCPEVSFEYLSEIRRRRTSDQPAPVTIFVATDAIEASALRTDARVTSKESVVEIMTQPCGPMKLAVILSNCLQRFNSPDENVWSDVPTTRSPLPSTARPSSLAASRAQSDENRRLPPKLQASGTLASGDDPTAKFSQLEISTSTPNASLQSDPTRTAEDAYTLKVSGQTGSIAVHDFGLEGTGKSTLDQPHSVPVESHGESLEPSLSSPDPPPLRVPRVLITDDNKINRRLLIAFLKRLDLPNQEAQNGLEALLAYQESKERFDVILMDISMPVMDGMAATRAIRDYEQKNNVPRARIIALTGLASSSARLEAWSSGVDEYMTKPVDFKLLETFLKDEGKRMNVDRQSEDTSQASGESGSSDQGPQNPNQEISSEEETKTQGHEKSVSSEQESRMQTHEEAVSGEPVLQTHENPKE